MKFRRKHKVAAMQRISDGGGIVVDRRADLANEDAQHVHVQQPPVEQDTTVQQIATILIAGYAADQTAKAIVRVLTPWGITFAAVQAALGLANTGTRPLPNARHNHHSSGLTPHVEVQRDREVYFRAAYVANAAKRIQIDLSAGEPIRVALQHEAPYFRLHEKARKERLETTSQVQAAADMFGVPDERGTLVGWYNNPVLNTETECALANGHNFYAEEGTIIGYPGSVHPNCGCYAGPPIEGAGLVDDALLGHVEFRPSKPRFKLKPRSN